MTAALRRLARAPSRVVLGAYVPARTAAWPEASHLHVIGDEFGWSIDDDADRLTAYMEKGAIEVAPLAFMRGRTLNDSFIILDEAQNTSPEQMQMFLTRLGFGSKVVVTGDVTQVDLPRDQASGLIQVQDILGSLDGVAFVRFGHEDVVRHKLVQRIVEAYRLHAEETGTERSR